MLNKIVYFLNIVFLILIIASFKMGFGFTIFQELDLHPQASSSLLESVNIRCKKERICSTPDSNKGPVCGTDGRTYATVCEMNKLICIGYGVKIHKNGSCPENEKCKLEREFQLNASQGPNATNPGAFVPTCNETDGSYANVQCYNSTGYCWCVTKDGKPIPSTSVPVTEKSSITCNGQQNVIVRVGRRVTKQRRTSTERISCTITDRSLFNSKFRSIIIKEYEKSAVKTKNITKKELSTSPERLALTWKFYELDLNKNQKLSRSELTEVRRQLQKIFKPASCARDFFKNCDMNNDKALDVQEWEKCLKDDISNEIHISSPSGPPPNEGFLKETSGKKVQGLTSNSDEPVDCKSHRDLIVERRGKNLDKSVYVPICTGDNDKLYNEIQCHHESGYCWCVNPENGEPISVTSMLNGKPKCDASSEEEATTMAPRMIKGCVPKKQFKFFKRLFALMEGEMSLDTLDKMERSGEVVGLHSTREKAAKWQFSKLDKNKNKLIERREWKPFRQMLRQWDQVKKCGRNFIRFCDADNNRKITLDEWMDCTVKAYEDSTLAPKAETNPFLHILKPDED